jgi:Stf0 sulphotransferase
VYRSLQSRCEEPLATATETRLSGRAQTSAPCDSYLICGTPQTSGTLVCGLLAATGVAAKPESHFRSQDEHSYADSWGVQVGRDGPLYYLATCGQSWPQVAPPMVCSGGGSCGAPWARWLASSALLTLTRSGPMSKCSGGSSGGQALCTCGGTTWSPRPCLGPGPNRVVTGRTDNIQRASPVRLHRGARLRHDDQRT